MPSQDLQKNLPHLIALAVLMLALLLIATKTGLVSCSSLGNSYCDMYYSILGKPTILIIRGDDGMGQPDTLARMIEDQYQLPVQKLRIDQISRGNIQDYSLIIVEHSRQIPTEKLKVFYDYIFEDMGRLVWVGDAGTIGASGDETCRIMQYSAEYTADDGKNRNDYEENICIKESDLNVPSGSSASAALSLKRDALFNLAYAHMEGLCTDAFEGKIGVYGTKGYPCEGGSYKDVYFKWTNEQSFRYNVNPWARGEYEKLTTEGTEMGIDFAKNVLGVGFVADDYAVAEFDNYYDGIDTVKKGLIKAHAGFVACSKNMTVTGCNAAGKEAMVRTDLSSLKTQKDNAKTDLLGIVSTLKSLAQQKEAKNESGYQAETASTRINNIVTDIEAVHVPLDNVTSGEITEIATVSDLLGDAREELNQLRGGETDATVKANYDTQISTIENRIKSFDSAITKLNTDVESYNDCASVEVSTVSAAIAAKTGSEELVKVLMAYSSPNTDETGAVDFINKVQSDDAWNGIASSLQNISMDCGGAEFTDGMNAASEAITSAMEVETSPANASLALATMQVADVKHPLVEGVTKAKDLKVDGLPVPFVLVETNDANSHEVIQLQVTPAYKGSTLWPGITVKDPKFASHMFGRGVVVYYAFPPETDEVFVKNLVEFMLY